MTKEIELIPRSDEFTLYKEIAKTAQTSQLFTKIGGEAGLLSIMLMARELGLPPMQALMGGMNVIQGKVELTPRLMNSMIRKAGHMIKIIKNTDQICELEGVRHDTKESYPCTYNIDDARRAGLVRPGGNWEKFPSDMLFARCLSRLARRLFADVISTAYTEGEIDTEEAIDPPSGPAEQPEPETVEIIPLKPTEEDKFTAFHKEVEAKLGFEVAGGDLNRYINHMVEVCKLQGKPKKPSEIMASALINVERFEKGFAEWIVIDREDVKEL